MSLLLVLFYFVGIPALVIAVAVWLWRKTDSSLARGLVMAGAVATLAGLLWLAQGEKWLADKQVRELCAKDGGGWVYETVTLPAEDKALFVPTAAIAQLGQQTGVWRIAEGKTHFHPVKTGVSTLDEALWELTWLGRVTNDSLAVAIRPRPRPVTAPALPARLEQQPVVRHARHQPADRRQPVHDLYLLFHLLEPRDILEGIHLPLLFPVAVFQG